MLARYRITTVEHYTSELADSIEEARTQGAERQRELQKQARHGEQIKVELVNDAKDDTEDLVNKLAEYLGTGDGEDIVDRARIARARITGLESRQEELLQTIRRLANETPFPEEAEDALKQRGALVAEVGTLRSQLRENSPPGRRTWVIESGPSKVWWWLGVGSPKFGSWTTDAFSALQFAREQDADGFARRFLDTTDYKIVELPAAEYGDAEIFFLNVCDSCGAKQEDGPCSVCPHVPFPGTDSKAEHFSRRPCRACRSINLRSIRVQVIAK